MMVKEKEMDTKIWETACEFFDTKLNELITTKSEVFIINFSDLINFKPIMHSDISLADLLLDKPDMTLKALVSALNSIYTERSIKYIRIHNLPKSCFLPISYIRNTNINKFHCFEGVVSRITDVIVKVTSIEGQCPFCETKYTIEQKNETINLIMVCSTCKRKIRLRVTEEHSENLQKVMLEDFIIEKTGNIKPVIKLVILPQDLADPKVTSKVQPGAHVQIIGIVKSKSIIKDSLEKDFLIEANNINVIDKSLHSIPISDKEIEKIKEMSKDEKILDKLAQSISPGTKGLDLIRKALVIQHFRSDNVFDEKGNLDDRGTINIGLVGSPGSNKTYMAKKSILINPISIFTSGKGLSGVGLIATVSHDKTLNCWVLDPGAVPICNKGMILIDEADKISKDDIGHLNNAMNDLEVPINKANVRAILKTDVNFLCCWNPENRIFVTDLEKFRQLGLPPDFLDRFDLIFALEATKDEEERKGVIKKIVKRHQGSTKPKINRDLFTKYVAYAWQNIHPKIDDKLEEYLQLKINEIMDPSKKKKSEVSYRIIGTVLRLSKAIARVYLSNRIRHRDVDFAIELLMASFKSLEMLDESNKITFESFERAPEREKIDKYVKFLKIFDMAPDAMISYDDLEKETGLSGAELDVLVEKHKKNGDIFEPKKGFIKRLA